MYGNDISSFDSQASRVNFWKEINYQSNRISNTLVLSAAQNKKDSKNASLNLSSLASSPQ
jgi:hypothetical protein